MLNRNDNGGGKSGETSSSVEGVHQLFEKQAAATPDATAVEGEDQGISYRNLNIQAERLAAALREKGVTTNSRVAICATRSIEMIAAVLGILKAGAGYVALDPTYPRERLAFQLQDSAPAVLVIHRALQPLLPSAGLPVIYLDEPPAAHFSGLGMESVLLSLKSLAYLLFTSGSTGQPKGVVMPHGPLVNLLGWHRRTLALKPAERVLQFSPLSFDVSFQEIFSTLAEGGTLVLMKDEVRRDPEALLACLITSEIQRLYLPFVALQQLAEAAVNTGRIPSSLKDIITAGEQLQVTDAVRAFFQKMPGVRLHNHYGPTETHVVTAYTLPENPAGWPTLPPIGYPIDHTFIHLLDARRNPVALALPGEIYISGAAVAEGYWHRDEITSERFLSDPLIQGQRMYRTGDLGQLRDDGAIDFLGRADSQIKIRGHRVELGEVESALRKHPNVRDGAVAVQPHGSDKMLVAFFLARALPAPSSEELRAFLLTTLPEPMVPVLYLPIEKLPLTPSGKLDRRALPVPGTTDTADSKPQMPLGSNLENMIAAAWAQAIGRTGFNAADSFFAVGGTSLMMAQVQRRLRTDLGRDIPITLLFQFPTIGQLAAQLGDKPVNLAPPLAASTPDRATLQREALARRQAAMRPKNR